MLRASREINKMLFLTSSNVMIKFLIILVMLSSACTTMNGQKEDMSKPDNSNTTPIDRVGDRGMALSPELTDKITAAKEIRIFRLPDFVTNPKEKRKGKKYFVDYEMLKSQKLDKKKKKNIKEVFLNAKNYADPDSSNKCTFTASLGIEFGKKLSVVISPTCKKILFLLDGKELYRDLNVDEQLSSMIQSFFGDRSTDNTPADRPESK